MASKIDSARFEVALTSSHPIEGAKIALANVGSPSTPETMTSVDQSQVSWQVTLPNNLNNSSSLQIVLALEGSVYFGETPTIFTRYKTGFPQDNISVR